MQITIKAEMPDGTKDWALIEMQGDLESRLGDVQMNGKFIGDLHYTKKGVPIFIIGHHILYGKITDLDQPFVIMAKGNDESMDCDISTDTATTEYTVKAIIKKKILFKTRPKPIIANVPKKI